MTEEISDTVPGETLSPAADEGKNAEEDWNSNSGLVLKELRARDGKSIQEGPEWPHPKAQVVPVAKHSS